MATGWVQTIRPHRWDAEVNLVPYQPWQVGSRAEDPPAPGPADRVRRDTAGTETTGSFDAGTDTTLEVETTQGPLWAETGASNLHLPLDIAVAGVRLRVTDIAGAVVDTFSRNETDGWGSPDIGPAWTVFLGDATEVSVGGGVGVLAPDGGDAPSLAVGTGWGRVEVLTQLRATGGIFGVYLRVDTGNQDAYVCLYNSDGNVGIFRLDAGVATLLAGFSAGPAFVANDWYWMRAQAVDDRIRMRVWADGDPEPTTWTLEAQDDTYTTGGVGTTADLFGGGAGETAQFDDFRVVGVNPQTFTVDQTTVNGIEKTIPSGSAVALWAPATRAL